MEARDRIRKFREKKGLSTNDVSRLTGISQSTISKLENGKRKANLEILEKIAVALEVSVDRLTGDSVSSIIENRLEETGMTLEDVEKISGVSAYWLKNIDDWTPGVDGFGDSRQFDYLWITKVAKALGLPGSQLRAALARQEVPAYGGARSSAEDDFTLVVNEPNVEYTPVQKTFRIPILGSIPAGAAIEAIEDIIGWEEIPVDWLGGGREYFALRVRGDSMYPEYLEGDTVIARKQSTCDSGDDCIVMLNDEDATLKRVHLYEDRIELEAVNKMYGRRRFSHHEVLLSPITILGVVVELRRKKK